MFTLLMRVRILSIRNAALDALRTRPVFAWSMTLASVVMFLALYFVFRAVIVVAVQLGLAAQVIDQILTYLFMFLFAGSVPFVAYTLFQSQDYLLLYASPVPPRSLVAARLIEATVTGSLQFAILGIPALAACASVSGSGPLGLITLPFTVFIFALLPVLTTALGLLALLRLLGVHRLKSAIAAINAITGAIVGISILARLGAARNGASDLREVVAAHIKSASTSPGVIPSPARWFAEFYLSLGQHNFHAALLAAARISGAAAALFAVCILVGCKLLTPASLTDDTGSDTPPSAEGKSRPPDQRPASPVLAIMRKDTRLASRDTILVSQTAMPMMLYLVPMVLTAADRSVRELAGPLALVMVGIILYMQTSILSLTSIGLESRGYWLSKCSPTRIQTVLAAKLLWTSSVSAVISVFLVLLSAVIYQIDFTTTAVSVVAVIMLSFGSCSMGVGISAAFPRFIYENPALRVSAWALVLGFIGSTAYCVAIGLEGVAAYMIQLQVSTFNHSLLIALTCGLMLITTTAFAAIPLLIGADRLERYAWSH